MINFILNKTILMMMEMTESRIWGSILIELGHFEKEISFIDGISMDVEAIFKSCN